MLFDPDSPTMLGLREYLADGGDLFNFPEMWHQFCTAGALALLERRAISQPNCVEDRRGFVQLPYKITSALKVGLSPRDGARPLIQSEIQQRYSFWYRLSGNPILAAQDDPSGLVSANRDRQRPSKSQF